MRGKGYVLIGGGRCFVVIFEIVLWSVFTLRI